MNLRALLASNKKRELPFIVWLMGISTMIACAGGIQIMGYNLAGYSWLIPFLFSAIVFFRLPGQIRFPMSIWLPWISLVLFNLIYAEAEDSFQRSVMILCPIFIGITISKLRIEEAHLIKFRNLYRFMAISLYVTVILKSGIHLTGALPQITGLAAEVMTGALLCTLFATSYLFGTKKDLAWWTALAAIPVIAITRMGILAVGFSLPLGFAPMKLSRRIVLVSLIILVGFGVFQSERVQNKFFYTGTGTIKDIQLDNPNFRTTGRSFMWDAMMPEIADTPWFGHGANASGPFVARLTGGLTHPHNDWLRLLYDYGYIGTFFFAISMLRQVRDLINKGRESVGEKRILFYTAASSFMVFSLFMITDNIILYAAFFGNFQFTIMGLAYAARATEIRAGREHGLLELMPRRRRLRW